MGEKKGEEYFLPHEIQISGSINSSIGGQPCFFVYVSYNLWLLSQKNGKDYLLHETKTTWPTKPKILIIWTFTKKVCLFLP